MSKPEQVVYEISEGKSIVLNTPDWRVNKPPAVRDGDLYTEQTGYTDDTHLTGGRGATSPV